MSEQQEPVIWMRPAQAAVGRPAERSRAEITAAAVALADREGLDAVSMRRLAATLGTGAASLYRYVATRDDLIDLMIDSTGIEYELPAPTGNWQSDLLAVARQARQIMRRHPWLPALVITRPVFGPHGADLLEHVLDVLADHPAATSVKFEAFALLNALTAVFVLSEVNASDDGARRRTAYLGHVAALADHPRISAALTAARPPADAAPSDEHLDTVLARALAGVLG